MRIKFLFFLWVLPFVVFAQPVQTYVNVVVAPDHENWSYQIGEKVKFNIQVLQFGIPLKNVKIKYEIGPEKMTPEKQGEATLKTGVTVLEGGTMKVPGFLRCTVMAEVEGKTYRGLSTCSFNPEQIQPTVGKPVDFESFWEGAKAELGKIPFDPIISLIPDRCTEKVNVYHVNLQNFKYDSRIYGILCVPKKEGKYPALLKVPGAGVRSYGGDIALAEKGVITFEIGIHGIPVNLDPMVYLNLRSAALDQYWTFGMENKDRFYYKRVYLACIRANDFLFSLPEFDGENLAVMGGSQGGALSIVTASLDSRVKFLAAFYPALSDVTGYLKGRAGGWPHYFNEDNRGYHNQPEKIKTCEYYDVVNFARKLKVPGFFSWGYNDETCPPTSMYAAYNVISSAKELFLAFDTGHWTYPEQRQMAEKWILKKLDVEE